jgi:hypothetical protein
LFSDLGIIAFQLSRSPDQGVGDFIAEIDHGLDARKIIQLPV